MLSDRRFRRGYRDARNQARHPVVLRTAERISHDSYYQ
jgi:hypothetical protein